jgi:hypothetical protein
MNGITPGKSLEIICCVCARRKGIRGWRKAAVSSFAALSHGYCPECYCKLMRGCGLTPVSELSLGEQ